MRATALAAHCRHTGPFARGCDLPDSAVILANRAALACIIPPQTGNGPGMAYVPGYEHDVFISYPRESDRADPQGVQWVREFHRYLETALDQRIPSRDKPDVFIDKRDFEAGNHSQMLIEA